MAEVNEPVIVQDDVVELAAAANTVIAPVNDETYEVLETVRV